MEFLLNIFFVILSIGQISGAKILGVLPNPAISHYSASIKFMKILADAGHNITLIVPYQTKDIPINGTWNEIVINGLMENYTSNLHKYNLYDDHTKNLFQRTISILPIMSEWVNKTLHNSDVRNLLKTNKKFDAVIMEPFLNDPLMIFAYIYQCPLILISSTGPSVFVNSLVGNPTPISYGHNRLFNSNSLNSSFTIIDKTQNLINHITAYCIKRFYYNPFYNNMLQHAFPHAPSIEHLQQLTSIVFINSHSSIYEPIPIVPNMIEIGGYHVDTPKTLPNDLQEFMDNALDGVIYFSMGSHLKSKDMSDEKKMTFLNCFKKLKQKILWKFEDEELIGLPDNVLIKKWVPQQDVLAHPNIKLFITHGGLLSNIESLYNGIPLLVIPVFADQHENAHKIELFGYGRCISYSNRNFNSEILYEYIYELLTIPKYRINAQKRSKLFHDRILQPKELIVYWTEYTIRTNGAKHLMVDGVKLQWYEYYLIDVFAFLMASVLLCYWIIRLILSFVKKRLKFVFKRNLS